MDLAFNELSAKTELIDTCNKNVTARTIIDNFVSFLHIMREHDLLDNILATPDIYTFYTSEHYGIKEWFADRSVKHTQQQFLRVILGKHLHVLNQSDYNDCEFTVTVGDKSHKSLGCSIASKHECPILSLETNDFWVKTEIIAAYSILNEDGEIQCGECHIKNFTGATDIATIKEGIKSEVYKNISSGQDLWEAREALYPNLIFCESVKDQLYADPEKFHILQIMKRLDRMQLYFSEYDGRYEPKSLGFDARTESETVKKDPMLKNMRKFRKPDGVETYFFDHIGFDGKFTAGRIHFLPQDDERKCCIGYIGRHLPTKKY